MSKVVTNKFLMVLYLLIGSFILEVLCFRTLGFGFLPEYWIYDIAIVLFLAMIVFAIPNYIAQYVISTIILIVQAVLIYTNYTLYCVYGGELFTFDMAKLVKEAADASNTTFFNYALIIQLVLVVAAMAVIGFVLLKRCKKQKINFKKHYAMLFVALFACLELISLGTVFGYRQSINAEADKSKDYVTSDSFLMNTTFMKESSYRKFGTFGFYTNLLLSGKQANENETEKAAIAHFNNGEMFTGSEVFGVDKGNNVIVVMLESLEWFAFGDGTYDPTLSNLSPELTPTIYGLIKGSADDENHPTTTSELPGLAANNFFAKSKTNISEGFAIMGNYPMGQSLTDVAGAGYDKTTNAFGYTLPSVLKSLGYTTSYVHSHDTEFYARNQTHNNIGFDKVFGKNDIKDENGKQKYTGSDIDFHHWMPEEEFVKEAINYIVPESAMEENGKFYTFYLNVSTHGSYNYNKNNADHVRYRNYVIYGEDDCIVDKQSGNYILDPNKTKDELTYTTFYQNLLDNYGSKPIFIEHALNYECGVIGLDRGLKVISDKLKEYEVYDKTTIMLFSDHYAYYDGVTYDMKGMDSDNVSDVIEANTIPFIISSPGIKTKTDIESVDMFCSAYDIIPTLFDLLGISYNKNFYVGSSVFEAHPIYQVTLKDELTGEDKTIDVPLKIYYSNVGGIYAEYVYTYNLSEYSTVKGAVLSERDVALVKDKAIETLTKLYYLSILNNNGLFGRTELTNKIFVQT